MGVGGVCCNRDDGTVGNNLIAEILKSDSLKLNKMTYNDLFNEVADKRVQQEIHKKHIIEYLIPVFFDKEKCDKQTDEYITAIFDAALSNLEEQNNLYAGILFFYPFINHQNEEKCDNFFSIFRFITFYMKFKDFESWLYKYVCFCTKGIAEAVMSKCRDAEALRSLNYLCKNVFSEYNLLSFVGKIMDELRENKKKEDVQVTNEMFRAILRKHDLINSENLRQSLVLDY